MKCPVCGKKDFENITLKSPYHCDRGGSGASNLFANAKLNGLSKGDIEKEHKEDYGFDGNWSLQSKVCMGCGYIVMFLPLEEMRIRKAKKQADIKKKFEAAIAAKNARSAEIAAEKKAEKEAEKERLKKRLAELEDSE
jgi:hypothetical protein